MARACCKNTSRHAKRHKSVACSCRACGRDYLRTYKEENVDYPVFVVLVYKSCCRAQYKISFRSGLSRGDYAVNWDGVGCLTLSVFVCAQNQMSYCQILFAYVGECNCVFTGYMVNGTCYYINSV